MSEINKMLSYWKGKLNLQDWKIKAYDDCSPLDMNIQNACGENEWDEVNKCSKIRIITEKDYGKRMLPFDKERILVHELLHIKFCLLDNSGNELQDRILHQMVEEFAEILVKVKRRK